MAGKGEWKQKHDTFKRLMEGRCLLQECTAENEPKRTCLMQNLIQTVHNQINMKQEPLSTHCTSGIAYILNLHFFINWMNHKYELRKHALIKVIMIN